MNYISIISSILLGLVGLAFIIAFHELGHFLFCKLFKIKTPSFSIGFGPKILSKNTKAKARIIPIAKLTPIPPRRFIEETDTAIIVKIKAETKENGNEFKKT